MAGQSPVAVSSCQDVTGAGAKPKRFKNWFKISSKSKPPQKNKNLSNYQPPCPSPEPAAPEVNSTEPVQEVVYYNFTSAAPSAEEAMHDDVFSDDWNVPGNVVGSNRTLTRRRHSFGSWFKSSLAAVRKQSTTSSTGSGLESANAESADGPSTDHRPSTSSERALLPRNVSGSANCVSYRYSLFSAHTQKGVKRKESTKRFPPCLFFLFYDRSRDVRTPEPGRSTNNNVSGEVKVRRSRLPIAVKSNVELRARARYARQADSGNSNNHTIASTSRIPRPIHQQSASLDRRYTNSTEVLTNEHRSASENPPVLHSSAADQRPETAEDHRFPSRDSPCASIGGSRKRISGSSTPSRNHRLIQRSRASEDRQRTSCCGRMAAAAPSSRRRSSLDSTAQPSRRRCQRCRDKGKHPPPSLYLSMTS